MPRTQRKALSESQRSGSDPSYCSCYAYDSFVTSNMLICHTTRAPTSQQSLQFPSLFT